MSRAKKRQGFTLIEGTVVLAILAILTSVLMPRLADFGERARIDADQATLQILNRVTPIARLDLPADDPFDDPSQTSEQLLAFLVDNEHLDRDAEPQSRDASFHWDRAAQHWVLQTHSPDDPAPSYLLTESDYLTGWASHVLESYTNQTQKNIRLPEGIDHDAIDARFRNGVLTVHLPRKPEARHPSRKIEVKAAK